jgi:hypothetical protein
MKRGNTALCAAGAILAILTLANVQADKVEVKKSVNGEPKDLPQDKGIASGAAPIAPPSPAQPPAKKLAARPPLAMKDEESEVLIFVESDREHVAAIDKDGKILWHRNVISEEGIHSNRPGNKPGIFSIRKANESDRRGLDLIGKGGPYVTISLTTRDIAAINERTGEFSLVARD